MEKKLECKVWYIKFSVHLVVVTNMQENFLVVILLATFIFIDWKLSLISIGILFSYSCPQLKKNTVMSWT